MNILFESNQLLVLNKPAGLSSDPQWDYPSAEGWARTYLTEKYGREPKFLALAHRLDRPASGVLLLVKKKSALREIQQHWSTPTTQKIYRVLTERELPQPAGTLEHYLRTDRAAKRAVISTPAVKQARQCVLSYRKIGAGPLPQTWEAEIQLATGRYHQIRAQLAAIDCPILGDRKYGASRDYLVEGIALHAAELRLVVGGMPLQFSAPPPWAKPNG